MEKITLTAEQRESGKKGLNRRLRHAGSIPAILYGKGERPVGLSINAKEFMGLMKGASGLNALIDLKVAGETVVAMLKDYQIDALTHHLTHMDLLKVNLKEKISVKVPVKLTGKAIGLTQGGLVEQIRREIEVRCLPTNIPGSIEVDITALEVGNSLHINDLKLPEGVEAPHEADYAIVSVILPREEVVEPVAVAPEAATAEAKPGEAAPAAGAKVDAKADTKTKEGAAAPAAEKGAKK